MNRAQRTPVPTTPLASTTLEVLITDLVAEYCVRHVFRNTGTSPIEAVYTFPVPLDAAFLGMKATLAGKTHVATIQPQRQAARAYDDAIAEGHSAVLLRAPEPGVLNVSLGNLMAGEEGEIELRFAVALGVADGHARFSLPLVHRPRYGTWRLEDLDQPTHDFAIEHPLTAAIRVRGLLASAPVHCATHAVRFRRHGEEMELSVPAAMLDRDLVLGFELEQALAPVARRVVDGDATLGAVTFVLPEAPMPDMPLDVCLVLDGSGSMTGDAIAQSRAAVVAVAATLQAQDRIQVLRFGSTVEPMFRRPLLATDTVRRAVGELAETVNADLGGTEMGTALESALDQLGDAQPARRRAIILVTDGAVQPEDVEYAEQAAVASRVQIFVIAVGSSAGAEVLAPLANATRARLERAVPAESIDAGVLRQFRRARLDRVDDLQVRWPGAMADAVVMEPGFPGEAVMVAACLPVDGTGAVQISSEALAFSLDLELGDRQASDALRALIGQRRYVGAAADARVALALQYGLLTKETSAVLVAVRAHGAQATDLPVVVPVAQMLPEGMLLDGVAKCVRAPASYSTVACHAEFSMDYLDIPAFLRRSDDTESTSEKRHAEASPKQARIAPPVPTRIELESLAQRLRDVLRNVSLSGPPTLLTVLESIPGAPSPALLAWLKAAGVALDSPADVLLLLQVLFDTLGLDLLTDEEEAHMTVLLSHWQKAYPTNRSFFTVRSAKLGRRVAAALGSHVG